jgi:hypothetical protein
MPFKATLFSLAHKRSFGFEFFIFEDGVPCAIPRFVIFLVSDFPYDVRKVAEMTIVAPKTQIPNPSTTPGQRKCVISWIFLNPGESFDSIFCMYGKTLLSRMSGVFEGLQTVGVSES